MQVVNPVTVVDAPDLKIVEYIGRVASSTAEISACVATVTAACEEAFQAPAFDEYVIVLEGSVDILLGSSGQTTNVKAGSAFILPANTRVQWKWSGPCKYVPICLPAFNIENCGREAEEAGVATAKSGEPLEKLRRLHASASAQDGAKQVHVHYQLTFGFWFGLVAGGLLCVAASAATRRSR